MATILSLSSSHLRELSWELYPVLTRPCDTEGSLPQRVTRFVKLRKNWPGPVTSTSVCLSDIQKGKQGLTLCDQVSKESIWL